MGNCLVCGKVGLTDTVETCPQCGADLKCFKLLDTLHEEAVIREVSQEIVDLKEQTKVLISSLDTIREKPNTAKNKTWPYFQWVLLILFLMIVWLVYRDWLVTQLFNERVEQIELQIETEVATQKQVRTEIKTSSVEQKPMTRQSSRLIIQFGQRLDAIEKMLTVMVDQQESISNDLEAIGNSSSVISETFIAAKPQVQSNSILLKVAQKTADSTDDKVFFYYQFQGNETLWSIAKHLYGKGIFFPLLLEYNPGLGIYYDSNFTSLKILKDRKKAIKQLRRLIVKTDEGRLFRYRVAAGDRWQTLSKRFYGNSAQTDQLIALNNNVPLTVGTRILIPLPE